MMDTTKSQIKPFLFDKNAIKLRKINKKCEEDLVNFYDILLTNKSKVSFTLNKKNIMSADTSTYESRLKFIKDNYDLFIKEYTNEFFKDFDQNEDSPLGLYFIEDTLNAQIAGYIGMSLTEMENDRVKEAYNRIHLKTEYVRAKNQGGYGTKCVETYAAQVFIPDYEKNIFCEDAYCIIKYLKKNNNSLNMHKKYKFIGKIKEDELYFIYRKSMKSWYKMWKNYIDPLPKF
jgi:hypothetical protein